MPELYNPKNIENGHTIPENDLVNCGGDLKKAFQNACVRMSQSEQNRGLPDTIKMYHDSQFL